MTPSEWVQILGILFGGGLFGALGKFLIDSRQEESESQLRLEELRSSILGQSRELLEEHKKTSAELRGRLDNTEKKLSDLKMRLFDYEKMNRYLEELLLLAIGHVNALSGLLSSRNLTPAPLPSRLEKWLSDHRKKGEKSNGDKNNLPE